MLRLDVDVSGLSGLLRDFEAPAYRQVGEAMDLAGTAAANAWEAAAYGARLPGPTRALHWPAYARTVEHHLRGETEVLVRADAGMTARATEARPARDMKPAILAGPHSKPAKAGGRYNRIPFSHRAESLSDAAAMALIQGVRNFRTNIGQRSKLNVPTGAGHYTWTTGPESGISMTLQGIRTWRTVSSRSDPASWWYPALPANPLLDAVWAAVRDEVEEEVFVGWLQALGLD